MNKRANSPQERARAPKPPVTLTGPSAMAGSPAFAPRQGISVQRVAPDYQFLLLRMGKRMRLVSTEWK